MKQHPLQIRQKSAIAKQRSPPQKQGKHGRAGGESISDNLVRGSRNKLIRNSKLIIQ